MLVYIVTLWYEDHPTIFGVYHSFPAAFKDILEEHIHYHEPFTAIDWSEWKTDKSLIIELDEYNEIEIKQHQVW